MQMTELEDSTMMKANEAMMSTRRAESLEGQLKGTLDELHTLRRLHENLEAEKGGGDELAQALRATSHELTSRCEDLELTTQAHAETKKILEQELVAAQATMKEQEEKVEKYGTELQGKQAECDKAIAAFKSEHKEETQRRETETSKLRQETLAQT